MKKILQKIRSLNLEATTKLAVYEGITALVNGDEEPECSDSARAIIDLLKPDVERVLILSVKRAKVGQVGGQHRWTGVAPAKVEAEKVDEVKAPKVKTPKPRFVPPTLEEVKAYITERGSKVDPEKWLDFYTSKDFYIGKTKMKDWKAAVRTWERDNNQCNNNKTKQNGSTIAKNATKAEANQHALDGYLRDCQAIEQGAGSAVPRPF